MASSLEGQTLGKYRILEPLGRGGMAQVYKAYHSQLDRYVAVKVLRSDLVEEKEFLARFQREARSVASLRHPNIVQVYDFDLQDDLYYMVMELLEGDTLKTSLNAFRASGEHISAGEMLRILLDTLAGLGYAHSQGIIHRDIKPANIMLTRHGQAVLTDFGIAQIVGATQYTASGALMGTLNYMAPEQGMTGQCDARSDIYSLGTVFYEMLTGKVPFDADTPLAILMKHVNDPLPLPRSLNPEIAEALEQVALKSLAKRPEERYQSAAKMSQALTAAAELAGIKIPAQLDLRLPVTLTASFFEPVAIFSGAARQHIPDPAFAADETDTTLADKLKRAAAPQPAADKTIAQINDLFKLPATVTDADLRAWDVPKAATISSLALVFVNLCGIWASGITTWRFFGYAWPMELVLIGIILAALMAAMANPWLLIPAGMLLGNGVIMAYCSLTGFWSHWAILWPLEPLLIAASIVAGIWLGRRGDWGRMVSRKLGLLLLGLSAAFLSFIILASIVLTVLRG